MSEDIETVDLSDYIRDYDPEGDLEDALTSLAISKGFDHIFDNTYVHRPDIIPLLPGATDFALSYNETEVTYNKKHLDGSDIYHALQDQEGVESDSWQRVRQALTDSTSV
ncbi:MAG: hypothetical protein J07AB43_10380 [Candidatus Nanosalina sp. J07AB43]|nr:MAG: hypothetical protein J07AB43_10380 [Candidatus Nanosalina sp. J07AB43]